MPVGITVKADFWDMTRATHCVKLSQSAFSIYMSWNAHVSWQNAVPITVRVTFSSNFYLIEGILLSFHHSICCRCVFHAPSDVRCHSGSTCKVSKALSHLSKPSTLYLFTLSWLSRLSSVGWIWQLILSVLLLYFFLSDISKITLVVFLRVSILNRKIVF